MRTFLVLTLTLFATPLFADAGLDELRRRVTVAIQENDLDAARELFLPELASDPGFKKQLPRLWARLQKAALRADYRSMGVTLSAGTARAGQVLRVGQKGEFSAELPLEGKRAAVELVVPEERFRRVLMTRRYLKRGQRWYLDFVDLGLWRLGGKDADQWFGLAEKLERQERTWAAFLRAQVGGTLAAPSAALRYRNLERFEQIGRRLNQEALKTRFPFNLLKLPGYPQVVRIEPDFDGGRLVPVVSYISRIPVSDADDHRLTAPAIAQALEDRFPGLVSSGERIVLRAYQEPPSDPEKTYIFMNLPVDRTPRGLVAAP